jgi:hypothetical protein
VYGHGTYVVFTSILASRIEKMNQRPIRIILATQTIIEIGSERKKEIEGNLPCGLCRLIFLTTRHMHVVDIDAAFR